MIAPPLLSLTDRIGHAARVHGVLALPWDRRGRTRLRALLASGEAVALAMPGGSRLRHGDLLRGDDGRVVRVVAAPEPTYALRCADPAVLARCALLLGRRRIAAEVCPWGLRIRAVPALRALVSGMGASVHEELAPFEPEAEPAHEAALRSSRQAPELDIDGA
ncbi:urease accessory protein UreE [uncultured Massilia sp.]|uniref:urease accessory protein UreE n=1 Tax=uncultured Massilia sp. TaxID=169973 RepID=UPI002582D95F|nr:urease accessory protein UreE [uncultured Massilia sp.]